MRRTCPGGRGGWGLARRPALRRGSGAARLCATLSSCGRYEAWKKLGTMSRAESMHLYVQAIEVFDERWLEWKGLQAAVAAAIGAMTPVASSARNGAPPKFDLAATIGSMRALRTSLERLPLAQRQSVRDECVALSRALDHLGKV